MSGFSLKSDQLPFSAGIEGTIRDRILTVLTDKNQDKGRIINQKHIAIGNNSKKRPAS